MLKQNRSKSFKRVWKNENPWYFFQKVTVIDMQMLICNYLYISSLCYTYNFHYAKFVYDSVQFDSKSFKVFTQQKLVITV